MAAAGPVGRAAETADDRVDRFAKDNILSVLCGWPVQICADALSVDKSTVDVDGVPSIGCGLPTADVVVGYVHRSSYSSSSHLISGC